MLDDRHGGVHVLGKPAQRDGIQIPVGIDGEHVPVREGLFQDLLHVRRINGLKLHELDDRAQVGGDIAVRPRPDEAGHLGAELGQFDDAEQAAIIGDAQSVILKRLLNQRQEGFRRHVIHASQRDDLGASPDIRSQTERLLQNIAKHRIDERRQRLGRQSDIDERVGKDGLVSIPGLRLRAGIAQGRHRVAHDCRAILNRGEDLFRAGAVRRRLAWRVLRGHRVGQDHPLRPVRARLRRAAHSEQRCRADQ